MPKILRSYFSRRVIILFSSLTLIFSLLIVIVPSLYRIQVAEQQVAERKRLIDTKVQSTYLPQAIYKARYLDQMLDAHEKDVLILADSVANFIPDENEITQESGLAPTARLLIASVDSLQQYAYENNCTFYATNSDLADPEALRRQAGISSAVSTMQSIVDGNPTIKDIFIRTVDQTEWVCPRPVNPAGHYTTYEYADEYYFPMGVTEWSLKWNTQFVDGIPLITVIAPVWAHNKFYGEVGISLQLSIVGNQAPQYNLSDNSQMFILDNSGRLLAVPSWVGSNNLTPWLTRENPQYLNKSFTDLMADVLGKIALTSHLEEKIKAITPIIFPIEYMGEKHYFAMAPVGEKSIKVLLILPLEDIYTNLTFWGDTFSTNILPILIELGLSIFGISLILTAGAVISIRYFTRPIVDVSNTALSIAGGDLSQRVPEKWSGELLELARSFNIMANNVQTSEKELLAKKDELVETLAIQKQEFETIRLVVSLTNQVSRLSKKLMDVLQLIIPIVGTEQVAVLLINHGRVYQSIIHKDEAGEPLLTEDELIQIAQLEVLDHPDRLGSEDDIVPIYFSGIEPSEPQNGFALPILEHGQLIGLITCCYAAPLDFLHLRRPFLSLLSNYLAVMIENAELQEKSRDLIITEERRHMANELHDAISQSLFSLTLTEESISHQIKVKGDVNPPLEFLMEQTQNIQEEMRWLINELRPIALHRDSLANSLERQVNSMRRLCPTAEINYEIEGEPAVIPAEIQNHLNRIVQEALSNILRHANAHRVDIRLAVQGAHLTLEITDDGIGFDLNRLIDGKTESYGIISMYGRSDQIKGTIDIQTSPGSGTRIVVQTDLTE